MKQVNTDGKRKELEDKLSLELDLLLGEYVATGDDERKVNIIELFENSLQQAHEKGRLEALDDEFEEAETRGGIAKENYANGYNDCKKGRKKAPHDTRCGWCCACSYDLAVMEEKIQQAYQKGREEERERIIGEIISHFQQNGNRDARIMKSGIKYLEQLKNTK